MKKWIITIVCLLGLCLSGCSDLIGKDAALDIALKDANVEKAKAVDIDVELESDKYNKWYEVEFDSGNLEYNYKIQAETGEILSSKTE